METKIKQRSEVTYLGCILDDTPVWGEYGKTHKGENKWLVKIPL